MPPNETLFGGSIDTIYGSTISCYCIRILFFSLFRHRFFPAIILPVLLAWACVCEGPLPGSGVPGEEWEVPGGQPAAAVAALSAGVWGQTQREVVGQDGTQLGLPREGQGKGLQEQARGIVMCMCW